MRSIINYIKKSIGTCYCILMLMIISSFASTAQTTRPVYSVKDGKMQIELSKHINDAALDNFISTFDLSDLDLKNFLKTNSTDSLRKLGWKLEKNNRDLVVISKLLRGFDHFDNPADKIIFTEKGASNSDLFPAVSSNIKYEFNSFRKKHPFLEKDSLVTFFLRNNTGAKSVMLAGSFNDWNPAALSMRKTDSGWIAPVKLGPGKYWYKFIADGNWMTDSDNARVENDGRGNDNSVFYKHNVVFRLSGFENAKKVFISGSFNGWQPRQLPMIKTATSWQLPVYLADGTHTYRFVVDGKWMADPNNSNRLPNEFNDFNSVLRIGTSYKFKLNGYTAAKQVILAGSFNNWRENELYMTQTNTGWELPYTLGAGNYEYRYRVDGKWITDPENPAPSTGKEKQGNAYLIIGVNHTFRLKGFSNAKSIFLAGDFNNWEPNTYQLKKEGDEWKLGIHLAPGKHTYKFIVDGKWIKDPANKLWEQNEHGTGNSVLWFERGR